MAGIHLLQPQPDGRLGEGVRTGQFAAQLQPLRRGPAAGVHPLVIDPIGTSSGSNPGHSSLNMARLTLPCSSETPLARCASRRPMWAMLNLVGSSSAPSARIRSVGTPAAASPRHRRSNAAPCPPGTGRYRLAPGVRGEHRAGPHHRQRGIEVQSRICDEFPDAFGSQEPGVTLVHVVNLGGRQPLDGGERADCPYPTDAGQDLLLDPVFLVTP